MTDEKGKIDIFSLDAELSNTLADKTVENGATPS